MNLGRRRNQISKRERKRFEGGAQLNYYKKGVVGRCWFHFPLSSHDFQFLNSFFWAFSDVLLKYFMDSEANLLFSSTPYCFLDQFTLVIPIHEL